MILGHFQQKTVREDNNVKRTFQNVKILVSLLALFVLLCGCEEDRRVNVEYNICSRLYRCDSEYMDPLATPVCFVMPDRHRDMIITFHTTEVFGFLRVMETQ